MSEQQNQNLVETYQDGKVVFDGKIIRLEHWTVKLPNGNLALREVACHPGASAVVALDDDNNISKTGIARLVDACSSTARP